MDLPQSEQRAIPAPPASRWFADEVLPHDAQLRAYLRSAFPAVRDVDDVAQESYLRLWKARAVQPIRSARAMLFTVARNLALDILRRRDRVPPNSLSSPAGWDVLDETPDAAAALGQQEKLDLLADAVVALPDRCREVILLHKIQGLSQREVAARLGLSERTVANHCRIAVKRCEAYLRRRGVRGFFSHDT